MLQYVRAVRPNPGVVDGEKEEDCSILRQLHRHQNRRHGSRRGFHTNVSQFLHCDFVNAFIYILSLLLLQEMYEDHPE